MNMCMKWFQHYKKVIVPCLLVVAGFIYVIFMFIDNQSVADLNEEWLGEQEIETTTVEEESLEQKMMVDMKGAVYKPGVYEAFAGDRVIDLIERAGGLTREAAEDQVNFAMYVEDEMVIYVPLQDEEFDLDVITTITTSSGGGSESGLININKADQAELETLTGIGPAKATAIIEYRETNGTFQSIEELKKVSGIGEKTFEKLQDQIAVK